MVYCLESGLYSNYIYETDYRGVNLPYPISIDCNYFYENTSTCMILDKISNESKQSVILGLIKRTYPDENHDLLRAWNNHLNISKYYDQSTLFGLNITDGQFASNGSMKNVWIRLINIYPSVFKESENYYYVPDQALLISGSNADLIIPNPKEGEYCKQNYDIKGFDAIKKTNIKNFETQSQIIPFSSILSVGEQANLSHSLYVKSNFAREIWTMQDSGSCSSENCTVPKVCKLNISEQVYDTAFVNVSIPIKRYSNTFSYQNEIAVPTRGFAQGVINLELPQDFLFYQFTIKNQVFRLSKNELKITTRGEIYPILQLNLISSPSRSGNLFITSITEDNYDTVYRAQIRYKLYIDSPNISDADCHFYMMTPFATQEVLDACNSVRSTASMNLEVFTTQNSTTAIVNATVKDQLSNPIESIDVEFVSADLRTVKKTDANGIASASVNRKESTQTLVARVLDTQQYAQTQSTIFLPGVGASPQGESQILGLILQALPIFLIIVIVSFLVRILMRKRTGGLFALLLLVFLLSPSLYSQAVDESGNLDVQSTLDACRNYDFENAVKHLGECSESYRIAVEFSAMRTTASVLVENIAPLVVANPDILPYKERYADMVLIALSLFRVAWAFNSLYLILNIFDPTKRSKALHQYAWLIVFVIFVHVSFSILQDGVSAVNSVAGWIAGTNAADNLSEATLSTQFVIENYEMLKLVLPFLNLSYLILLARYILVIGMILFFPFSLLLFFTSATRGFGKATLTVTFASLGLGVLNAILLLIYNILVQTQDMALAGSFASTFFSASFLIFFGFINLIVLSISFLSGIVFIGGGNKV